MSKCLYEQNSRDQVLEPGIELPWLVLGSPCPTCAWVFHIICDRMQNLFQDGCLWLTFHWSVQQSFKIICVRFKMYWNADFPYYQCSWEWNSFVNWDFALQSNFDEESIFLSKAIFHLSKSYISQWCFCVMSCTAVGMHLELFLLRLNQMCTNLWNQRFHNFVHRCKKAWTSGTKKWQYWLLCNYVYNAEHHWNHLVPLRWVGPLTSAASFDLNFHLYCFPILQMIIQYMIWTY